MPLNYWPADLASDVANWSFADTVSGAMRGIAGAGQDLMRPISEHLAQAQTAAAPPAPDPIAQPEVSVPEVPRFSLGRVEDWLPPRREAAPTSDPTPDPTPDPSTATDPRGRDSMFSLPSVDDFLGPLTRSPSPAAAAPSRPSAPAASPAPSSASDPWAAKAYAAAVAAGHPNPTEFAEQMRWESGGFAPDVVSGARASSAGARGIAQIMPEVARGAGIDPLDPDAALAYAARRMAGNYKTYGGDSERALAEYNMGAGNLQKYGPRGLAETNKYIDVIGERTRAAAAAAPAPTQGPTRAPTPGPAWGVYTAETLTPSQITEGQAQGLSSEQALAICGPAAAVAFARANGRNPTLKEAKDLAEASGVWDASTGMHGPADEVALLEKMGIPSRLEQGADWGRIAQEVSAGRPVIVDTPGHYYTVNGAYPDGSFELGQSAGVLKAAQGRTRFRPEEIPGLGMGAPRSSIYERR